MAIHSSILAWRIPWMEEPGRLQSLGCWVRHNWETSLSLFTFMHWKRKWQPTPVFLPGESQGWGSLVGCQSMGSHRGGHDWSDLAATASWNLERQYQQSYMQNCKGDTDVKNRLLDSVGEGEGGMSWENVIVTCILPYVKQMTKCKFDIWSRIPKASTQGQARGIGCGGRWNRDSGWCKTHEYLWPIHVDVGKNHHNIIIILQLK